MKGCKVKKSGNFIIISLVPIRKWVYFSSLANYGPFWANFVDLDYV